MIASSLPAGAAAAHSPLEAPFDAPLVLLAGPVLAGLFVSPASATSVPFGFAWPALVRLEGPFSEGLPPRADPVMLSLLGCGGSAPAVALQQPIKMLIATAYEVQCDSTEEIFERDFGHLHKLSKPAPGPACAIGLMKQDVARLFIYGVELPMSGRPRFQVSTKHRSVV